MPKQTILIIGEIFVDTHLDIIVENGPLVRLGGIFHSARAYSALDADFALAYYAPDYLEEDINFFSCILKSKGCYKLGTIKNAPNVMLVNESKEVGNQGYYNIIKDQAVFKDTGNLKQIIEIVNPTDILIYPGRYDTINLIRVLSKFEGKIHIDFHYDSDNILNSVSQNIETILLSTSSSVFKDQCKGTLEGVINYFKLHHINRVLVKENRGGAYCFSFSENKYYESPSYYVPTMHSVGVGDVYNSIFISNLFEDDLNKRMRFSSLCAAKYAETMSFDKFKKNVQLLLNNIEEFLLLEGIRLSWEERGNKNIYLAAPDFPDVNTKLLEKLADSLKYHNFNTRLPIRENGLVKESMKYEEEHSIYQKDLELIATCDLLIAVLLFNDPGTLVELGMFKQTGKPTIIYDPYDYCKNMFVRHTPDFLCRTIEEVIDATYQCLKRR